MSIKFEARATFEFSFIVTRLTLPPPGEPCLLHPSPTSPAGSQSPVYPHVRNNTARSCTVRPKGSCTNAFSLLPGQSPWNYAAGAWPRLEGRERDRLHKRSVYHINIIEPSNFPRRAMDSPPAPPAPLPGRARPPNSASRLPCTRRRDPSPGKGA